MDPRIARASASIMTRSACAVKLSPCSLVCDCWRKEIMSHLKQRLIAILLILFSAAMIYYGWYRLREEGVYSLKMATFAPLGVVGGIFLLLFPSLGGKPNTTKEKVIVLLVFLVGLAAGVVNWYLMDPGFFGR